MSQFDQLKIQELSKTTIESLEEIYERIDSRKTKNDAAEKSLRHLEDILVSVKFELSEDKIKAVFE